MDQIEPVPENEPNIFSYLDYRRYLKDLYRYKKLKSKGFSYRVFLKSAGFKSSNFLKLVIDGKRNLTPKVAYQFAYALKMEDHKAQFFLQMVLFNQSKTSHEKRHHYEQIIRSGHYRKAKPLDGGQYAYFSSWYLVALRELVTVKDFKEHWPWINRKLGLNLSAQQIRQAIDLLLELNLLKRNERGRLVQTDGQIQVDQPLLELNYLNFHREMIRQAEASIDRSEVAHRDLSGLTVSLGRKQFEQIKKEINLFRCRVHQVASESEDPEAVYQINFQLFNLSEVPWK